MAPEPASPGPLAGRVALVTGAAQGMGAAHARRLAREGAVVAVNDLHDSDSLRALADEIGGLTAPGDVSEPGQVRALVSAVAEAAGCLDVLVANHAYMTMAPFLEHAPDDWWKVVDTNLGGPSTWCRRSFRMRAKGSGRIVVVTSEWGITGWPGATAYAASKAGLVSLVKTLGRELAPEGIIVNAIAPGVTDTPQLEVDARDAGTTLEEMHRRYAAGIPLGRIGTADEMAAVVALLADFRMSAMVGQWVQANGGATRTGRDGVTSRPRPTARGRKMAEQYARYDDGVVGQVDGLKVPRYAGLTTFARLPRLEDVDDYDVAVVGVPWDSGVTYRPGARFGPSAIRQASRLPAVQPALDAQPFRDAQVVDAGDVAANPSTSPGPSTRPARAWPP